MENRLYPASSSHAYERGVGIGGYHSHASECTGTYGTKLGIYHILIATQIAKTTIVAESEPM